MSVNADVELKPETAYFIVEPGREWVTDKFKMIRTNEEKSDDSVTYGFYVLGYVDEPFYVENFPGCTFVEIPYPVGF